MFITQALKRSAQLYSDRLATVCKGRERTWSEVEARVAKFAGALRKLGVENGERVAILSLNSDRYYEYFFATPWAGGVFVPINIRLAPPEVAFWLNDSGSEILLIDDREERERMGVKRDGWGHSERCSRVQAAGWSHRRCTNGWHPCVT